MVQAQRPVLVIPPAEPPVSLEEAKRHLSVEHVDHDPLIGALIDVATAHLDGWSGTLGRCLVSQTWRQDLSGFPDCGRIDLPLLPVSSVTSVSYTDPAGAAQTLGASVYRLHADARGAYLALVDGQSWPGTATRDDAVRIAFVAGYGAADDVPRPIRQAILLLVGHWYEFREAAAAGQAPTEIPFAVAALTAPYRRIGL